MAATGTHAAIQAGRAHIQRQIDEAVAGAREAAVAAGRTPVSGAPVQVEFLGRPGEGVALVLTVEVEPG